MVTTITIHTGSGESRLGGTIYGVCAIWNQDKEESLCLVLSLLNVKALGSPPGIVWNKSKVTELVLLREPSENWHICISMYEMYVDTISLCEYG